jgi:hypothetical protein
MDKSKPTDQSCGQRSKRQQLLVSLAVCLFLSLGAFWLDTGNRQSRTMIREIQLVTPSSASNIVQQRQAAAAQPSQPVGTSHDLTPGVQARVTGPVSSHNEVALQTGNTNVYEDGSPPEGGYLQKTLEPDSLSASMTSEIAKVEPPMAGTVVANSTTTIDGYNLTETLFGSKQQTSNVKPVFIPDVTNVHVPIAETEEATSNVSQVDSLQETQQPAPPQIASHEPAATQEREHLLMANPAVIKSVLEGLGLSVSATITRAMVRSVLPPTTRSPR